MNVIPFPKTVYIVDGDLALCHSAQSMLKAHGRAVHCTDSADSFTQRYLSRGCVKEHDVILLDLNTGDPSSYNLLNRLMMTPRRPAIVLATDQGSALRPEDRFENSRICVLQYPIAPQALLHIIDCITARTDTD